MTYVVLVICNESQHDFREKALIVKALMGDNLVRFDINVSEENLNVLNYYLFLVFTKCIAKIILIATANPKWFYI